MVGFRVQSCIGLLAQLGERQTEEHCSCHLKVLGSIPRQANLWLCSVVASTQDSDSCNASSNLARAFILLLQPYQTLFSTECLPQARATQEHSEETHLLHVHRHTARHERRQILLRHASIAQLVRAHGC